MASHDPPPAERMFSWWRSPCSNSGSPSEARSSAKSASASATRFSGMGAVPPSKRCLRRSKPLAQPETVGNWWSGGAGRRRFLITPAARAVASSSSSTVVSGLPGRRRSSSIVPRVRSSSSRRQMPLPPKAVSAAASVRNSLSSGKESLRTAGSPSSRIAGATQLYERFGKGPPTSRDQRCETSSVRAGRRSSQARPASPRREAWVRAKPSDTDGGKFMLWTSHCGGRSGDATVRGRSGYQWGFALEHGSSTGSRAGARAQALRRRLVRTGDRPGLRRARPESRETSLAAGLNTITSEIRATSTLMVMNSGAPSPVPRRTPPPESRMRMLSATLPTAARLVRNPRMSATPTVSSPARTSWAKSSAFGTTVLCMKSRKNGGACETKPPTSRVSANCRGKSGFSSFSMPPFSHRAPTRTRTQTMPFKNRSPLMLLRLHLTYAPRAGRDVAKTYKYAQAGRYAECIASRRVRASRPRGETRMSDRGGREDDLNWDLPRSGGADRAHDRGYDRDEGLLDEPYAGERGGRSAPGRSPGSSGRGGVRRGGAGGRSGSDTGLYGSQIGSNVLPAAVAELIGTFILVYTGTAVGVATVLDRPITRLSYDSLAIPLAFGLVLVALVAALGHV